MGVYGLAWTPAIIFETIWTPGPNFGSKGPLAPNLKIAIFLLNLTIWVSMDLPWHQQPFLKWSGPRDQIFAPRALWPQIKTRQKGLQNNRLPWFIKNTRPSSSSIMGNNLSIHFLYTMSAFLKSKLSIKYPITIYRGFGLSILPKKYRLV